MRTEFTLPSGEKVNFIYLRRWPKLGEMIYLQGVRSGRMKEDSAAAQAYKGMAQFYASQLANMVLDELPPFDAVVSPPSKRGDTDVYRSEILSRGGARDLTVGFSRKGTINAATASSIAEVVQEFDFQPTGIEAEITSLLIVDESVATGRSIVAVLQHLRRAGLRKDCIISVAAPAWLNERNL